MSLVDRRSHPAGRTHSTPDEVIEHGLRYACSLGLIRSWSVERTHFGRRRQGPRRWVITWSEGHVSTWATTTAAAYCAGVHDAMEGVRVR